MSDEIEKKNDEVAETAATEAAASAETEEKPKPARKPRATKAKAADEATEAPAAEEAPKPARKPRATKPKADASAAAEVPRAEKTSVKPAKAEKPAPAAKPKAAPKRGAAKHPEQPVSAQVVRAQAKYVRSSARKARVVCDNIRGKSVTDARAILAHTPRAVARDWSKLLESAIANAENNHDLDGEDLVIKAVHADEGPTIKRFRPRAMGRATQIRKRTAHLTILLTPKN